MAVIFIACTSIIPVSAENITEDLTYCGPSIEYLGELDTLQARGVTRVTGRGFTVYLGEYIDGTMNYYSDDGFYQSSTVSGYTPYNFTVSQALQNKAAAYNLKYLVIELTFSVEGTGTMQLEFESNGSTIITGTIYQQGYYKVMWHTPIQYSTYGLTIRGNSSSNSYSLGGHISLA